MDEELKRAMEKGEILTIGDSTPKLPVDVSSEILKDLDLSDQIIQHNFPIGIDFSKHISPTQYFPSVEILQRILAIPFLTTENHYNLESLLLLLTQGKINRYYNALRSTISSQNSLNHQANLSSHQQTVFIDLLAFLLSIFSFSEEKWPTQTELNLYFIEKKTNIAHTYRSVKNLTSSSEKTNLKFAINIILQEILNRPLDPFHTETWIQIKYNILSSSYSKAENQIHDLLDGSFRKHLSVLTTMVKHSSTSTLSKQNSSPQNASAINEAMQVFLPEVFQCLELLILKIR